MDGRTQVAKARRLLVLMSLPVLAGVGAAVVRISVLTETRMTSLCEFEFPEYNGQPAHMASFPCRPKEFQVAASWRWPVLWIALAVTAAAIALLILFLPRLLKGTRAFEPELVTPLRGHRSGSSVRFHLHPGLQWTVSILGLAWLLGAGLLFFLDTGAPIPVCAMFAFFGIVFINNAQAGAVTATPERLSVRTPFRSIRWAWDDVDAVYAENVVSGALQMTSRRLRVRTRDGVVHGNPQWVAGLDKHGVSRIDRLVAAIDEYRAGQGELAQGLAGTSRLAR